MKKHSKELCIGVVSILLLSTQLTIGCGPSTPYGTVDISNLPEGTGIIKGVVTAEGISTKSFSIKGTPDLSLATVKVSSLIDTKEVKVAKDGSFSVPVKGGADYTVEATVPDGNGSTLKFVTPEKVNVPMAKDPPVIDVKSLVTRKTGSIQGIVSIDGSETLEGMDVFIPGTSSVGKTDAKGRFAITGVAAGKWKIVIQKPEYARELVENIIVNAGEATLVNQKITLKKGTTGSGIKGIVQDGSGKPVAGVTVTAYPNNKSSGESGLESFTAITNEIGEYKLSNLPVGKLQIQLYRSFYELPERQYIEINANETKDMETLRLVSNVVYFGKISGKIINDKNKPLYGVIVQTYPQVTDQKITDIDGNFTLDRVMPGEYDLNITTAGYLMVTVPIRVENVQNYELKLENPFKLKPGESDDILIITPDGKENPVPKQDLSTIITPNSSESYDFGDLPDSFKTFDSSGGAKHLLGSNPGLLKIGDNPGDADIDGMPGTSANGDDINGKDDEDGISSFPPLTSGDNFNTKSSNDNLFKIKASGFSMNSDNSGNVPRMCAFNYNHTITNTTTSTKSFSITIQGNSTLNYQIFDSSGSIILPDSKISIPGGSFLNFIVKVTVPKEVQTDSVEKITVQAKELSSGEIVINNDTTTVIYSPVSFSVNVINKGQNGTENQLVQRAVTGDILEYSIIYKNYASLNSLILEIKNKIPENTTYIPGSLLVNSVYKTDISGDDSGYFDTSSSTVKFFSGSETNTIPGSTLIPEQSASVAFKVKINAGIPAGSIITNSFESMIQSYDSIFQTLSSVKTTIDSSGVTKNYSINIKVTNNTGKSANLRGWIDFNRNGIFDSGEESAVTLVSNGLSNGTVPLTWNSIPSNIREGQSYVRIRLTTDSLGADDFKGVKTNGEVEDYSFSITQ